MRYILLILLSFIVESCANHYQKYDLYDHCYDIWEEDDFCYQVIEETYE